MPDDQDATESLPYSLYGDPSDPFSQLSSARALAMSPRNRRRPVRMQGGGVTDPNDPNYGLTDESTLGAWANIPGIAGMDQSQIPLMPATQRAQELSQQPGLYKDVQPAGWRTALGLAAQWFTQRHPQFGEKVAGALASTDPNVKAHQELLNQYAIANQQAQAERENLGTMATFSHRNALEDIARARLAESQQRDRQAAEDRGAKAYDYLTGQRQAQPISPISPVAPLTPSPAAQLPQVRPPSLDASANLGQNAPPTVTPGAAPAPPGIGTVPSPGMNIAGEQLTQARNPYTREVETLSGPTQQTLNEQKAAEKPITNAFELWRSQNPKGKAEDWLKIEAANKPETLNEYRDFRTDYLKAHPGATAEDTVKAYAAAHAQPEKPPQALMVGPDGKAILVRPGTEVPTGAQTTAGVNAVNTPTMQMRNVAAQAALVHEQTPHMLSEIDRLKDKLGPMAGRWNEVMQGKVGLKDPDFAGLRADLLMYSSAVALMHARGRLPENLREEFDRTINNPSQDFENLKTVIKRIDDWTSKNAVAMGGRNPKPGPNPAPSNPKDPMDIRPR